MLRHSLDLGDSGTLGGHPWDDGRLEPDEGKPSFPVLRGGSSGDARSLTRLKLFAPAMLVLACRSLCWPGSALAQALGRCILSGE